MWVSTTFILISSLLFEFFNLFELFPTRGPLPMICVLATFGVSNIILLICAMKRLADAGMDVSLSSLSFIPIPFAWSVLVILLMFKPSNAIGIIPATRNPLTKKEVMIFLGFLAYLSFVFYLFIYESEPYRAYFSRPVGEYGSNYYVVSYPTHKRINYSYSVHGFSSDHILKDSDPASFEILNETYARDKKYVYFGNQNGSPRQIPIAGEVKFLNKNYFATGDKIYFNGFELPSGTGVAVPLDDNYVSRGEKVYFQNKELVGAVASNFSFVGSEQYGGARLAKSGSSVYLGPAIVETQRDGLFLKQSEHIPLECTPDQSHTIAAVRERGLAAIYGLEETYEEESRQGLQERLSGIKVCKITQSGEDERVIVDTETLKVVSISPAGDTYMKDKDHVYFGYYNSDLLYGYATTAFFHVVEQADSSTFGVEDIERDDVSGLFRTGCTDIQPFWNNASEAVYPEIRHSEVLLEKGDQNYKNRNYCFYTDRSYMLPEYK